MPGATTVKQALDHIKNQKYQEGAAILLEEKAKGAGFADKNTKCLDGESMLHIMLTLLSCLLAPLGSQAC
jgi:hypothetical protein